MPAGLAVLTRLVPGDVPVVIGREDAARLAREELSKPQYSADDQPWVQRVLAWVLERISDLLDTAGRTSPLGWLGLLGIVLLGALVIVAVRRRSTPLRRGRISGVVDTGLLDARAHRAEADRLAAAGAYAEAVRARLRAVVADLEERGALDPRPGRTADEVARDAGTVLSEVAGDLAVAARLFDDVWYGERPADATTYARMVQVDERVAIARPARSTAAAP